MGFERLNAIVRWTIARRRLDDGDTIIFAESENVNESPYPPHKNRRYLRISPVFIWFWADNGIRKAVKKTCRWHVLGRGRIPWFRDTAATAAERNQAFYRWKCKRIPLSTPKRDTRLDTISSLVSLFMLEWCPEWGVVPTFFVIFVFGTVPSLPNRHPRQKEKRVSLR